MLLNVIKLVLRSTVAGIGIFSQAAIAADAENGARLAKQWCASCHVVSPEQQRASADVPPFATIGRKPDFESGKLAFFLLDPHPKMPNMSLTSREAADIAAYIAELGRNR